MYFEEETIFKAEHEVLLAICSGDEGEEFAAGEMAGVLRFVEALLHKGEK